MRHPKPNLYIKAINMKGWGCIEVSAVSINILTLRVSVTSNDERQQEIRSLGNLMTYKSVTSLVG